MFRRTIYILAAWSAVAMTSWTAEPLLPDANEVIVEPNAPLTLPKAWAAALLASPELGAFAWEVRSPGGGCLAGRIPAQPGIGDHDGGVRRV